jgi:hypothetical protein
MEKEIIKEFETKFKESKKKYKIKSSFQELDDIFLLKDFIEKEGYVSTEVLWQIRDRIMNLFSNWASYLHGIIIPNPSSMLNITESAIFSDKEKEEINKIMSKMLTLTSKNSIINLTKNKKEEAKLIDESKEYWIEITPKLKEIMIKIHDNWKEKA